MTQKANNMANNITNNITNNMTTQNYGHAASVMRHAKITPPSALRGRLFLTLLMMLFTATPSWAQDNTTTTWSEWIENNNMPQWYNDVLEVLDDKENDQDEFIISTPDQFAAFAKIVNDVNISLQHDFAGKTVKLGANIDLGTPYYDSDDNEVTRLWDFLIGDSGHPFNGTFDGQGHTIKGLVTPEDGEYGLFGYIGEGGTVRNVSLGATCHIYGNGEDFAGIAYTNEGLVENCACAATLTYTGDGSFSGIVHYNEGTVQGCYYVGPYNENMSHVIILNNNNSGTLANNYYYAATQEDDNKYNFGDKAYDCTRVFAIRLPAGVTVIATDPENVGIMVGRTFYAPNGTTVTLNVEVDNNNEYEINEEDINLGSGEENDVFAIYFPNAVNGKDEVENPNPVSYTVEDEAYDEIELLNASRPGYEFGGWYEDENCEGERVYSFLTNDTGDKTFWAKWLELFTITYHLNGGLLPNGQSNPAKFTKETPTFTLVNPTKMGYRFTGWTGTGLGNATESVTIEQGSSVNRDYTANWIINQYTITFDTGGGTSISDITQDYDTDIIAPADPSRTGYTFEGWDKTIPAKMPAEDMTITAQWTPIDYAINYNLDGGTNAIGNPDSYTFETPTITLGDPSKRAYTFTGWTGSNGETPQSGVTIAQGSTGIKNFTAHWTPTPLALNLPVTLTATVGGVAVTTATVGQTVTLAAKSGYSIAEEPTVTDEDAQVISVSDQGNGTYTFTMPTSAVTVTILTIEQGWTFTGTYATVNFGPDDTDIYGFVGTASTDIDLGTFVRVGGYVRVKPLRAYLRAPYKAEARKMTRSAGGDELPQSMTVRLIGANGDVTAISAEPIVKNEESATATDWYTLDGRRLTGAPTQKGIYINGNRKVIIK